MRKILVYIFCFFSLFEIASAADSLNIISRDERGANESLRYLNGPEWEDILEKRRKDDEAWKEKYDTFSEEKKLSLQEETKKANDRRKRMNEILSVWYPDAIKLRDIVREENGEKLAWPIEKSEKINSIIIHHTLGDYETSVEGVQKIYNFHALSRQWGDIGYNYLIGYDGEIFEGRAGGDYAVGAHSVWNNRSTMGIAVIGDYTKEKINEKQYESLKKLVGNLIDKYDIDVTKQFDYHRECLSSDCVEPLESYKLDSIVGHRDSGHTSCPGDALYEQIHQINDFYLEIKQSERENIKNIIANKKYLLKVKDYLDKKIAKMSDNDSLKLLEYSVSRLERERNKQNVDILKIIESIIKSRFDRPLSMPDKNEDEDIIKIRLSYPYDDKITIKNGFDTNEITVDGNNLILNKEKHKVLKITPRNTDYLEISSWQRIPSRDKEQKYNDNKFRGNLIVYIKDKKLVVVNQLKLSDYLKGLGEVSNFENKEKIKTIIIAARSYAKWYIGEENRKFPGEWYDGSDNPDVFQKYLGYELEKRSPKVNEIVEETKGIYITYNGELIKPWYSSSSSGKTLSFKDYCLQNNNESDFCDSESEKYPYLLGVRDPGAKKKSGHGVGISGAGTSFLVAKGWTAEMIIKYYLNGVEIKSL